MCFQHLLFTPILILVTANFILLSLGSSLDIQSVENTIRDGHEESLQMDTKKVIWEAKKRIRPDLRTHAAWERNRHYETFDFSQLESIPTSPELDKLHVTSITPEEFLEKYENQYKPLLLTGVMDNWPGFHSWSLDAFARDYGDVKFGVGEDAETGKYVRIPMKHFIEYAKTNKDDSPLYLFEDNLEEHPDRKPISQDWFPPPHFQFDLLRYAGKGRPPYRWILIGPKRSGTSIHIDPLGTSAWNGVIAGRKLWILFHNKVPKELLNLGPDEGGIDFDEGITWFKVKYPQTKLPSWPKEFRPIEVVQRPGEILFVPGGWWHVVLNLDTTIGVSQNFCSRNNFPIVWHKTARGRPKLSRRWLRNLRVVYPDLARLADRIDLSIPTSMKSDGISDSPSSESESEEYDQVFDTLHLPPEMAKTAAKESETGFATEQSRNTGSCKTVGLDVEAVCGECNASGDDRDGNLSQWKTHYKRKVETERSSEAFHWDPNAPQRRIQGFNARRHTHVTTKAL